MSVLCKEHIESIEETFLTDTKEKNILKKNLIYFNNYTDKCDTKSISILANLFLSCSLFQSLKTIKKN